MSTPNKNRRKKKEYVISLENKIEELENKIEILNEKIWKYKQKDLSYAWGIEKDYKDYEDSTNYFRNDVSQLFVTKERAESAEKMIELCNTIGPKGEDRVNLIKKNFKGIIELIIPDSIRVSMNIAENMSKVSNDDYLKLFKMKKEDALEELKKECYSSSDRILYNAGDKTEMRKIYQLCQKPFSDMKNKLTHIVHDIIRVRNRIFDCQKLMHQLILVTSQFFDYNSIGKILKYCQSIEDDDEHLIFEFYSIKKKDVLKYSEPDPDLTGIDLKSTDIENLELGFKDESLSKIFKDHFTALKYFKPLESFDPEYPPLIQEELTDEDL